MLEFVLKYAMKSTMKYLMLEKSLENHGLSEFASCHLLEVGPTQISGDQETLFIVYNVGFHVDFSSMKSYVDL